MSKATIYTLGGTVQASSGTYIRRRADGDLLALCREGRFAYVLASRQMGKSSLMVNAARQLTDEGILCATVDLTGIGVDSSIEQWYRGFLHLVTEHLELSTDVIAWWQEHADLSITERWMFFLKQVILLEVTAPIVIFVDEVDATFSLSFADQFFTSIRTVYEARSHTPEFGRFSFVLLGVATPSDLMRSPIRNPFNIAASVELTDFTFAEASPLSQGLGLPPETAEQVLRWILDATGGHPYLTQRLCRAIAERGRFHWSAKDVMEVVADTFFGVKVEGEHNLLFVRDMLLRRSLDLAATLLTYRDVWRGRKVLCDKRSIVHSHLRLSGIVRQVDGYLQVRNSIYREVFDESWIKKNLPDTYKKRISDTVGDWFKDIFSTPSKYTSPKTPEEILEEKIQQGIASGASRLDLTEIGLIAIPDSIGQLAYLRELDISNNQLRQLPPTIGQLTRLQSLRVSNNRLIALPESVGALKQLLELDLSNNQLRTLPEALGQLTHLRELNLSDNQLSELPHSLSGSESLKQLYLHGNPALNLPPEVLGPTSSEAHYGQGRPARPADILEYYLHNQRSRPLNEAKLILVGRGGVGKTSIVNRLVHGTFDPNEKKTEGIKIISWQLALQGEEVRLNVWDFGGQEIMHATHQFFLTQRSLYLLVLNAREGEQEVNVDYWLRIIESFGAESPVLVVINKVKDHLFDLNRRGWQTKFPGIHGFIQTDCEDGTGIEELRGAIEWATGRLNHLRDPFPSAWFRVKNRLGHMKENFITYERYQEICQENGVDKQQSQDTLVDSLHHLGIVLNFKDDHRLRDTHVLNPEWVTNGVYQLLNAKLLANKGGVLEMPDLGEVLDKLEYPREKHLFIIDLMQKFELCFRFEGAGERYLIPELLNKEEPGLEEFEAGNSLRFQYHYNILPEGLMPRFIVRTHEMSAGQPRWRTGVVLEFGGNRALVKADVPDRKVFITVTGGATGRRHLLAIIRSHLDHIHRSISKLEAMEMVPVAEGAENVVRYSDLLVFEERQIKKVPMVVNGKLVEADVMALLNGIREHSKSIRLVYSYSHKDEALRDELETHLAPLKRQGFIESWHDRKILPGQEWAGVIDENFETAEIILLLVSADFIASDYCYETEMEIALRRHKAREAYVFPVILRNVDWNQSPFANLQALPKDGKPITLWSDRDSAWSDVAAGIRRVVEELRRNP